MKEETKELLWIILLNVILLIGCIFLSVLIIHQFQILYDPQLELNNCNNCTT